MPTRPYDQFGHKVQIEPDHYRTHRGQMFIAGHFWSETASTALVADNEIVVVVFNPGGCHTLIDVAVGGECEVYHYKGATTSASTAATEITPVNKNSYSSITSDSAFYWGTTALLTTSYIADATEVSGILAPGGTGGNAIGARQAQFGREFIMSTADTQVTTVQNRSGGVIPLSITYEWYEPGAS